MKKMLSLLLAAAIMLTLAGCSGGDSQSQPSGGEASTGESSSSAQSSQGEDSQRPDSIKFWSGYTQESRINAMTAIAERYQAETGTAVEMEVIPWGSQAEKWRTAFAANELPAAMTTLTDQVMYMHLAEATVPLDDIVENLGGKDAFMEGALASDLYNGEYVAIPHYAHCRLLYYRKDLLDTAGVTLPDKPTPEEVIAAAAAVTDPGKNQYGFVQCFKPSDETSPYWLDIFMKYHGADWFDGNNKVIFNSPETVEAVNDMVELYQKASVEGAMDYGDSDLFTLFTTGVTAMTFQTGFLPNNIIADNEELLENVGVCSPPGWMLGVINLVVFDNESTEYGKEFVEFLYREDNYMELINTITPGQTPVLLKYLEDDSAYWQHENFTGKYADLMMKTAELNAEGCAEGTFPGTTEGLTIATVSVSASGIIQEMFADILVNGTETQAAVANAAEKLQKYIDDLEKSEQ